MAFDHCWSEPSLAARGLVATLPEACDLMRLYSSSVRVLGPSGSAGAASVAAGASPVASTADSTGVDGMDGYNCSVPGKRR